MMCPPHSPERADCLWRKQTDCRHVTRRYHRRRDCQRAVVSRLRPVASRRWIGPPYERLPRTRVVHRCLEKNREQRFQSSSDLAFALEAVSDPAISPATGVPIVSAPGDATHRSRLRRRVLAAAATAVAILLLVYRFWPAMPMPHVTRVEQLTKSGGARADEPLYTDGPRIYYQSIGPLAADWQLRQVLLNGDEDTHVAVPAGLVRIRGLSPDNTDLVDSDNVGMIQCGRRLRLLLKPPQPVGI